MAGLQERCGIDRELVRGMDRAVSRATEGPSWIDRLGTRRPLDRLCRKRPGTVRETVVELALMRAGYQRISYRRALRQIVRAALKGGSRIDTGGGI